MKDYLFKDRDGQTPLPPDLRKGLKKKTLQTVGELDEHEEANIAKGLSWLAKQKSDPKDYAFWLKLHKKLFGDVWTWAGEIRKHELNNPYFLHPNQIWSAISQLQLELQGWFDLHSYSLREIIARFHVRFESIHPFANGNGRCGRILADQISRFHNLEIPTWGGEWSSDPKKRRSLYIRGLDLARNNEDYSAIIQVLFSRPHA